MTRVVHSDLAAIRFCNRGARQWFERHGLNWSEFVRNGMDVESVRHIDDAMMNQVIERAERRERGEL